MSIKKRLRKIEIRLEIFALNVFMGIVATKIYVLIFIYRVKNLFKDEM